MTMSWLQEPPRGKAALWFLGQSGFLLAGGGRRIVIDPYLSDSVGRGDRLFTRSYPVPLDSAQLSVDIFIVTHDHLDHLDPETISAYPLKESTWFVAPRFAAKKLASLLVPEDRIVVVDQGESAELDGVTINGVFALPTGPDVLDTTGYSIVLPEGQSVYHTSDTGFCDMLVKASPKTDVLLTCINGKFGNLTAEQAVTLAKAVAPKFVIPHHYDVMIRNSENPESFRYFCDQAELGAECLILGVLQKFIW